MTIEEVFYLTISISMGLLFLMVTAAVAYILISEYKYNKNNRDK